MDIKTLSDKELKRIITNAQKQLNKRIEKGLISAKEVKKAKQEVKKYFKEIETNRKIQEKITRKLRKEEKDLNKSIGKHFRDLYKKVAKKTNETIKKDKGNKDYYKKLLNAYEDKTYSNLKITYYQNKAQEYIDNGLEIPQYLLKYIDKRTDETFNQDLSNLGFEESAIKQLYISGE
jgi:hypothetical protein